MTDKGPGREGNGEDAEKNRSEKKVTGVLALNAPSRRLRRLLPLLKAISSFEEEVRVPLYVIELILAIVAFVIPGLHFIAIAFVAVIIFFHLLLSIMAAALDFVPTVPRSLREETLAVLSEPPVHLIHRKLSGSSDLERMYRLVSSIIPLSTSPEAERYSKLKEWLLADDSSFLFVCHQGTNQETIVGFTSVISLRQDVSEQVEHGNWSPYDGAVVPESQPTPFVFVHGAFLDPEYRAVATMDFYRLLLRHVAIKSTADLKVITSIPLTRRGKRACQHFSLERTPAKSPRKNRIFALHLSKRPDLGDRLNAIRSEFE